MTFVSVLMSLRLIYKSSVKTFNLCLFSVRPTLVVAQNLKALIWWNRQDVLTFTICVHVSLFVVAIWAQHRLHDLIPLWCAHQSRDSAIFMWFSKEAGREEKKQGEHTPTKGKKQTQTVLTILHILFKVRLDSWEPDRPTVIGCTFLLTLLTLLGIFSLMLYFILIVTISCIVIVLF